MIDKPEMINKLRKFEKKFPDKTQINLFDAKKYLEKIFGTQVDDNHVKNFLLQKGYENIVEETTKKAEIEQDDLDLDDIINMKWVQKKSSHEPEVVSSFGNNLHILKRYQEEKSPDLLNYLVKNNERLVRKLAGRYMNYMGHSLQYEDLVAEGMLGLLKAIEKFDVNTEYQFSTYATWWIRQAITRAICDKGTLVRIPVHMVETIRKIKKMELTYLVHNQEIDVQAICEELGTSVGTYHLAKKIEYLYLNLTSLDQFVSEEDQDTELGDFITVDNHLVFGGFHEDYFNPASIIEQQDIRQRLREVIKQLKPREQDVIYERFGFNDNYPKTLEEIGQKFGVTRERIRQIEKKALNKLRARITRRPLREDFVWTDLSNWR